MAIQLTYSYRKELSMGAEFSASHRIKRKLVETEISFPCARTSNVIQSGSIRNLWAGCLALSGLRRSRLIRFSARIS